MKNLITALLIVITSSIASAQNAKHSLSADDQDLLVRTNHQCIHRNKYTASRRTKLYPFNKATRIKFVSLRDSTVLDNSIPLKNDTVDYTKLIEIKTLTKEQTDQLTDILFNVGEKRKNIYPDRPPKCYNPHNAILFVDARGHTFGYLEICFHCSGRVASSRNLWFGRFCEGKYELLKQLFQIAGIKTGITEHTNDPG